MVPFLAMGGAGGELQIWYTDGFISVPVQDFCS